MSRPVPPRRGVPPPPPRALPTPEKDDLETRHINGLAACVATINIRSGAGSTISRSASPNPADLSRLLARRPPPPPRRVSTPPTPNHTGLPPPPPPRRIPTPINANVPSLPNAVPPTIPSRRLPPVSPNLNQPSTPPPPPVNLASKPGVTPIAPNFPIEACLQCQDFSGPDHHASLFPRESVASLQQLAFDLVEPFDDDVEKARALFAWLSYNISYDTQALFSGNVRHKTPEETLSSGLAVCEGYAGLFEHLADNIGLQAHTVTGHGKGLGYTSLRPGDPTPEMQGNHAWNCVLIGEEWHLIDPCWGAGAVSGMSYEAKLAPKWFISSPAEFGRRHFPTDPSYQLTPEEMSWDEYILAPEGPTLTVHFDDFGFHPMLVHPPMKQIPNRQFIKFSMAKRCEHMSTAEIDNYVYVISTKERDFTPLVFDEEEQEWSVNAFTPRGGEVTLYAVETVNNEDAKGLGIAGFTKAKGRKQMTFIGMATWTVSTDF
ncbi:hypothetical protein B0H34DRAFT_699560 [Crassisporium funariophilum]|nr:hypothetical protein B0H34DRAFT_699560 [Crassisporium funariophilum]